MTSDIAPRPRPVKRITERRDPADTDPSQDPSEDDPSDPSEDEPLQDPSDIDPSQIPCRWCNHLTGSEARTSRAVYRQRLDMAGGAWSWQLCDDHRANAGEPINSHGWEWYPPRPDQPRHRRTHDPRDCAHCGETYTPTRKDAKYCSSRCRTAAHRTSTVRSAP